MRYFIEFSYNGKAYHGWQKQPNAITVQEVLEDAISKLLNNEISLVGAGRTDTGVHAFQMFAHFDSDLEFNKEELVFKLNAFLPKDIVVIDLLGVSEEAHARFDAVNRTYIYKISQKKDAFNFNQAVFIRYDLDVFKMNKASKILLDYKNFKCFSRSNSDVKTYNCDVSSAEWSESSENLVFTIKADRFLRNMVRAVVGTLLDIGAGKMEIEHLHTIIQSEDRSKAGASAPAHGLYLAKIEYPNQIFK